MRCDSCEAFVAAAEDADGPMKLLIMSIGTGKIMVEFFSADMELSVCKIIYCKKRVPRSQKWTLVGLVTCKYRS